MTDTWRAYFSQAIFPILDLKVGFLPRPLVVRNRTFDLESEKLKFKEEINLYTKTSALISHLYQNYIDNNERENKSLRLVQLLEELWIDMFERGYIEEDDVQNIQWWLVALLEVGYVFPDIKRSKMKHRANPTMISKIFNTDIYKKRQHINYLGRPINSISLIQKKCTMKYNLTFANSDLHDGPKIDIPSILLNMGQRYLNVGPKLIDLHKEWNLKGRNPEKNFPNVMKMRGMLFDQERVSTPLKEYSFQTLDHSTTMRFSNWSLENAKFYSHNQLVNKEVNAFICSFPAAICQIWKHMKKPIIFLTAHRYNLGRCTLSEWRDLNLDLMRWVSDDKNHLGNTVGAVSRYDLEY